MRTCFNIPEGFYFGDAKIRNRLKTIVIQQWNLPGYLYFKLLICTTLQGGPIIFPTFNQNYRLLYTFIKLLARLALPIFCRKIVINDRKKLSEKGPLLLAANHPNSFLDSIIINTIFKEPVSSLARGDVFEKPFHIKLLKALKMFPVYRTREGVENLSENYKTFEACIDIFKQNGVVTIYSEGQCINEWHLRPLKKGTARLTMKAWEQGIPLRVLPLSINYSSFTRFGKNMFLFFGEPITMDQIDLTASEGLRHAQFNQLLEAQLSKGVFEIPIDNKIQQKEKLELKIPLFKKILLAAPAITGWLIHFPLYQGLKKITIRKTASNSDHFDSVLVSLLMFVYPLFLITITLLTAILFKSWYMLLLLLVLPFCAWCAVQLKPQLDK